jgi:hypothetical protein
MENLNEYIEHIKADYAKWDRNPNDEVRQEMIRDFNITIRCEVGRKYAKIIQGGSVHSFICLKDDSKFKAGDILMAASWTTPARNFARGNIFEKKWDRVRWTGAL